MNIKNIPFVILIALALVFSSCNSDDENANPVIGLTVEATGC